MAKKVVDLTSLGEGAVLKEVAQESAPPKKVATKPKEIRNMPAEFFKRHADLKATGRTSLLFTAFIIEAVRKALEEHEQQ
ncbi:hypothetical protein QMX34_003896 [Aeromonas hydrophila]|nr:hypothetical protein [Aeromonas hydrophila]